MGITKDATVQIAQQNGGANGISPFSTRSDYASQFTPGQVLSVHRDAAELLQYDGTSATPLIAYTIQNDPCHLTIDWMLTFVGKKGQQSSRIHQAAIIHYNASSFIKKLTTIGGPYATGYPNITTGTGVPDHTLDKTGGVVTLQLDSKPAPNDLDAYCELVAVEYALVLP